MHFFFPLFFFPFIPHEPFHLGGVPKKKEISAAVSSFEIPGCSSSVLPNLFCLFGFLAFFLSRSPPQKVWSAILELNSRQTFFCCCCTLAGVNLGSTCMSQSRGFCPCGQRSMGPYHFWLLSLHVGSEWPSNVPLLLAPFHEAQSDTLDAYLAFFLWLFPRPYRSDTPGSRGRGPDGSCRSWLSFY